MKKVTQIVAYYNEEKYIKKCIDSLLQQTYKDLEIIIVNDGSTDKSPEIVAEYNDPRIIVINNEENHGQAYCRNQGLEIATGEYIGFFDGDDVSFQNRIELLAGYLDNNADIDCVSGRPFLIDNNMHPINNFAWKMATEWMQIKAEMLFGCAVACSCALFRKKIVQEKNLRQNTRYKSSQDYHFWMQFFPEGKFANIEKYIFYYRIHESQTKKITHSYQNEYPIWMSEIFMYGWNQNGIEIDLRDGRFIYDYLYSKKKMWRFREIKEARCIYDKIKNSNNESKYINLCRKLYINKVLHAFILTRYIANFPLFIKTLIYNRANRKVVIDI